MADDQWPMTDARKPAGKRRIRSFRSVISHFLAISFRDGLLAVIPDRVRSISTLLDVYLYRITLFAPLSKGGLGGVVPSRPVTPTSREFLALSPDRPKPQRVATTNAPPSLTPPSQGRESDRAFAWSSLQRRSQAECGNE